MEFLELLRLILNETTVERVRISSIEPLDVTQDLIELFASNERIAPHFHMPLQSASTAFWLPCIGGIARSIMLAASN